jgi:hypothetical protein
MPHRSAVPFKRCHKMDRLDIVLRIIDEAFDRKSWHGTNLRGSIRGLDLGQVSWRPHPDRHNIWEIVMHAAYWKYAVRRRLTGEPRRSFFVKGSNWFRRPLAGVNRTEQWNSDVALLVSCHKSLRNAIVRLGPDQLETASANSRDGIFPLLTGIAAHDLYHAGQIQLLKRFHADRKSRTAGGKKNR